MSGKRRRDKISRVQRMPPLRKFANLRTNFLLFLTMPQKRRVTAATKRAASNPKINMQFHTAQSRRAGD